MNKIYRKYNFCIAEKKPSGNSYLYLLRWSLIIIFLWFGGMKFTHYEALGIAPFIENSPLTHWLHIVFGIQGASYFLGITEITTAILLFGGAFNALLSALGAFLSSVTFLVTMTFFITTPGVFEPTLGGFPFVSANIGQFLLKDLVLLCASLCLLRSALLQIKWWG